MSKPAHDPAEGQSGESEESDLESLPTVEAAPPTDIDEPSAPTIGPSGHYSPEHIAASAIADVIRLRAATPVAFEDSRQHLRMELGWIRRLLARLIFSRYARGGLDTGSLSVPDREIAEFLGWEEAPFGPLLPLEDAIEVIRELVDSCVSLSHEHGVDLLLPVFARRWKLDVWQIRIIVALLAPELDPGFGRAYCYAWNDFQRKLPTIGFLAELLGAGDKEAEDEVVRRLLPTGQLVRTGLVVLPYRFDDQDPPVLARPIQLANRVALHLFGVDEIDERLAGMCATFQPKMTADDLVLARDLLDKVSAALLGGQGAGPSRVLLLGPRGTGKKSLVGAYAQELGQRLLLVDMVRLWRDQAQVRDQLARALREAVLQDALPFLDLGEEPVQDNVPWWLSSALGDVINAHPGRVVFASNERPAWLAPVVNGLVELSVPFPSAEDRYELWQRALPQKSYLAKSVDLQELANQFALSGGSIQRAASAVLSKARSRNRKQPRIRFDDLAETCTSQIQHRLSTLARRVATGFKWNDMVLEKETIELLEEMLTFARHKRFIMREWGFRAKLPYGAGLSSLFSGPPGTGKTMAASIMARDLGMELFRIDLSRVVNKYIGETEKNLGRIFDEAQQSNAVLLFDEADSLFSKRTDVRSSVDRYANLEVNYLLQRMEDFEGVTILTTNMEASLDDAFKRRLKFRIHFPFPDGKSRAKLWKITVPRQADVAKDIEWDKLGAGFELSGGHIKNAVLRAAIMAAAEKRPISHIHLKRAAEAEYREMGKLVLG